VSAAPRVSVVVVAYRARADVLRCLASLCEHVRIEHEVVVVDDGSGDGTPHAVRAEHPEAIVVARPRNGGLVAGRNDALAVVRGRHVLMLDADTEVRPGAVEALSDALEADPRVGLVGPRLLTPSREVQLSCRRWPPLLIPLLRRGPYRRFVDDDPPVHRRHLMKDFDHATRRPVVWVSGAAQMYRRELADRLGPYDRRLSSYGGEDLDWCLRTWAAGLEVHYVPAAEVIHREQGVTQRERFGRRSFRALRDWYYLQAKHRRLRRDPRLEAARA
jgi:GT2 family glycosyltransferase